MFSNKPEQLPSTVIKNSPAFTLIELLVVIAIIGLLSSIVFAAVNNARAKARDARRIADLREVQKALEMYYADHGKYPSTNGQWRGTEPKGGVSCYGNYGDNAIPGLAPTYIPRIPRDPKPSTNHCYLYRSDGVNYMFLAHQTMETVCDGVDSDTRADPGDECNPPYLRVLDRPNAEQPTISVYSPGARNW